MIEENISLQKLNTFGIDTTARYFFEIRNNEDLDFFKKLDVTHYQKLLFLGEGSNILFSGDFGGLLINMALKGRRIIEETNEHAVIEFAAGENWHDAVQFCTKSGFYGLENLALIPGTMGAAPVQNIGAYGVEQCDYFHYLRGILIDTREKVILNARECRFGYRDSIFKHEFKGNFLITHVAYRLSKIHKPKIEYPDLIKEFESKNNKNPDAMEIFDAVTKIRRNKLTYPEEAGNAGSFFKNPVISVDQHAELKEKFPEIRSFDVPEGVKLSAAWLIEQCGWKGRKLSAESDASVSPKHSLVLINLGNATGAEILELSDQMISSVREKYGISLEREVNVV